MMKRVFVDTNIIIDLLSQRINYFEDSQYFFSFAHDNNIQLFVSTLSFANTHYILSDRLKVSKVRNTLRKFKTLINTVPFDDKILKLALGEEFRDFEDAIQYYSAIQSECEVIITRNKKEFKMSEIPVLSALEFLNLHQ